VPKRPERLSESLAAPKKRGAREAHRPTFLTKGAVAEAVGKYIKAHPKTYRVTVGVKGKKVVVEAAGKPAATKKRRRWTLPPPGFFAKDYTAEDAAEDNRFAKASVAFDPADFRE
jgi:hypothetical protein